MTSGSNSHSLIRKAVPNDLDAIKQLTDQHRHELGFVLRPALQEAIADQELFVAEVEDLIAGFVHYHHRRDRQTTLYHIAVREERRGQGIGRALIEALSVESTSRGQRQILLKCPKNLAANDFYANIGLSLICAEKGKRRELNVWVLQLEDQHTGGCL